MSNLAPVVERNGNVATAEGRPGVTREEHERRLFFVAEKLLEGLSRRQLVEMAMTCFRVGRRAAQKYVAVAERRLRDRGMSFDPVYYFALSRMQRDKLLEGLLRRTSRADELEAGTLANLVTVANKLLDSRDRVAALCFRAKEAEVAGDAPEAVQIQTVHAEAKTLRSLPPALALEHQPAAPSDEHDAEDECEPVPPEVMRMVLEKVKEGCSMKEAVDAVFEELEVLREGALRDARGAASAVPTGALRATARQVDPVSRPVAHKACTEAGALALVHKSRDDKALRRENAST
jgi:hypothetical protein